LVNSKVNPETLNEIQDRVRELRRVEFREEIVASGNKLHSRMNKMFKLSMFSAGTRSKLASLVKQIQIFYGKLLIDTARGLWKEINGKSIGQINWKVVRKSVDDLKTDIAALTAVHRETEQATAKP